MPEEIIGENKFKYLVTVEISLESTRAFVLKHLDTEICNCEYYILLVKTIFSNLRGFIPSCG